MAKLEICEKCDQINMPHATFLSCQENEIKSLRYWLERAEQRIEFLEDIVGVVKRYNRYG